MSIPGIFKNNPFEDPTKDFKDTLKTNKELLAIIARFMNDIRPWTKLFLVTASFMMAASGLAIMKVVIGW